MKKTLYIGLALLLVAVIALAAGCNKAPEKGGESEPSTASETESIPESVPESLPESNPEESDESEAPTSEPAATGLHFKTGTWATKEGTNYVFYEDGKGGKTVNVAAATGLGFEYELDADGKGVFHMGSLEDETKVTVEFIEGGDDTAAINWENGSRSVLLFVSEDISDDFAYHYLMDEVSKD